MPGTGGWRIQGATCTSSTIQKKARYPESLHEKNKMHENNSISGYNLSSFQQRYFKKNKDVGIVAEITTKEIPVTQYKSPYFTWRMQLRNQ